MPTQSALDKLGAGLAISAFDQAQQLKGAVDTGLKADDVRKLLTIAAAEGDTSVMAGNRLQQLGKAEVTLEALAKKEGISTAQMLGVLRQTAPISQELFDSISRGEADPVDALAQPDAVQQAVQAQTADAAQQAALEIPPAVLERFDQAIKSFASPGDREPALQVLQQALALSKAASYSVASALLFAE